VPVSAGDIFVGCPAAALHQRNGLPPTDRTTVRQWPKSLMIRVSPQRASARSVACFLLYPHRIRCKSRRGRDGVRSRVATRSRRIRGNAWVEVDSGAGHPSLGARLGSMSRRHQRADRFSVPPLDRRWCCHPHGIERPGRSRTASRSKHVRGLAEEHFGRFHHRLCQRRMGMNRQFHISSGRPHLDSQHALGDQFTRA
jgi:hypothetical protein